MGIALRLAGFEIRDSLHWIYGSGFPKSLNVSKAIDAAAGAEREVTGPGKYSDKMRSGNSALGRAGETSTKGLGPSDEIVITAPATPAAIRWDGWGTAVKPSHEPIIVARKPLTSTVAGNVLEWGTGALNVDGCRVAASGRPLISGDGSEPSVTGYGDGLNGSRAIGTTDAGRWPPNILLTHLPTCGPAGCAQGCAVHEIGEQSGTRPTSEPGKVIRRASGADRSGNTGAAYGAESRPAGQIVPAYGDTGTAARFFPCFRYEAKASRSEREAGCDDLPAMKRDESRKEGDPGGDNPRNRGAKSIRNPHPTVKPSALMRWLVRLVTPPGAAVQEGADFVGLELSPEYAAVARARIAHAIGQVGILDEETDPDAIRPEGPTQTRMF
jgi:site-specific DNA-methyltransferase (adenine-specific)